MVPWLYYSFACKWHNITYKFINWVNQCLSYLYSKFNLDFMQTDTLFGCAQGRNCHWCQYVSVKLREVYSHRCCFCFWNVVALHEMFYETYCILWQISSEMLLWSLKCCEKCYWVFWYILWKMFCEIFGGMFFKTFCFPKYFCEMSFFFNVSRVVFFFWNVVYDEVFCELFLKYFEKQVFWMFFRCFVQCLLRNQTRGHADHHLL